MIFLIHYDRARGCIVDLRTFDPGDRAAAEEASLQLELTLGREGTEAEVVLLDAKTEEALRKTHRRYFEDLAELTTPA